MSRTVKSLGWGALLLGSALLTQSARAHESPHGLQLIFTRPEKDAAPIVLTNRGIVFPTEEGAQSGGFSLRCNAAYGANTAAIPHALLDETGALVIATTAAVKRTVDRACTYVDGTGLPDLSLGGFVQNPSAPNEMLLTTLVYDQPSKIFASQDYGRTWSVKTDVTLFSVYETLVTSSDGQRLLASGKRYDMVNKKLLNLWSTSEDGGKTWADQDIPDKRAPLGFHPTDPKVVFAKEEVPNVPSDPRDRLLRSSDGGKTFETIMELPAIGSFEAKPDGSKIWVGSQINGLYVSEDAGKSFTHAHEGEIIGVYCLQYRQDRLWACTRMAPNTGGLWFSDDQGAVFQKLFAFEQVTREVSCGEASTAVCDMLWKDWTYELLSNFDDAGVASADAGVRASRRWLRDQPRCRRNRRHRATPRARSMPVPRARRATTAAARGAPHDTRLAALGLDPRRTRPRATPPPTRALIRRGRDPARRYSPTSASSARVSQCSSIICAKRSYSAKRSQRTRPLTGPRPRCSRSRSSSAWRSPSCSNKPCTMVPTTAPLSLIAPLTCQPSSAAASALRLSSAGAPSARVMPAWMK